MEPIPDQVTARNAYESFTEAFEQSNSHDPITFATEFFQKYGHIEPPYDELILSIVLTRPDESVLQAFRTVNRADHVPEIFKQFANLDQPIYLHNSLSTNSQPSILAIILNNIIQHSHQSPKEILEIGAGSGYLAALLSNMYPRTNIHATEIATDVMEFGKRATKKYQNVSWYETQKGNLLFLTDTLLQNDLYDWIIVSAGSNYLPKELLNLINQDGILTIPITPAYIYTIDDNIEEMPEGMSLAHAILSDEQPQFKKNSSEEQIEAEMKRLDAHTVATFTFAVEKKDFTTQIRLPNGNITSVRVQEKDYISPILFIVKKDEQGVIRLTPFQAANFVPLQT